MNSKKKYQSSTQLQQKRYFCETESSLKKVDKGKLSGSKKQVT